MCIYSVPASSDTNKWINHKTNNDAQLKQLLLTADKMRVCLTSVYVPLTNRHGHSHTPKNAKYACLGMSNCSQNSHSYSFQLTKLHERSRSETCMCQDKKVSHSEISNTCKEWSDLKYSLYHEPNSFYSWKPHLFLIHACANTLCYCSIAPLERGMMWFKWAAWGRDYTIC